MITEIQASILDELAHHPAGPFMIARALDEPPFRIVAEIRLLAKANLARLSAGGVVYLITGAGVAELGGIRRAA